MPAYRAFATFYRAWFIADVRRVNEALCETGLSTTQFGVSPQIDWLSVALTEVLAGKDFPTMGVLR
jgi:hypothetical protein